MKKLIIFLPIFLSGCQIQLNVMSSVVNIPVTKTQNSIAGETQMTGSALDEVGNGNEQKNDAKATGVP